MLSCVMVLMKHLGVVKLLLIEYVAIDLDFAPLLEVLGPHIRSFLWFTMSLADLSSSVPNPPPVSFACCCVCFVVVDL